MTHSLASPFLLTDSPPTRQVASRLAAVRPLLREAESEVDGFGQLRGRSAPMLKLYRHVHRVAPTDATVLLVGETGTGKEAVARTIHALSERCNGAFVAVNCGAISATLIESELFGHEQGSFTGANRRHNGVFALADNGTLFLDEITEMSADLQVKLLRVLETSSFHRIGGEKPIQTNARFIAATNCDPEAAVRSGKLRADLFYRLRVFPITLPPLRDRGTDVEALARHFLDLLNAQGATDKHFSDAAIALIKAYAWPGNVRELKHFVQQSFILADREIDAESLRRPLPAVGAGDQIDICVGTSIARAEQHLITATMNRCTGDKNAAAKILGISLKTLYCRLKLYAAGQSAVQRSEPSRAAAHMPPSRRSD
jgi:DNA-binding NtrC family response regulator